MIGITVHGDVGFSRTPKLDIVILSHWNYAQLAFRR